MQQFIELVKPHDKWPPKLDISLYKLSVNSQADGLEMKVEVWRLNVTFVTFMVFQTFLIISDFR